MANSVSTSSGNGIGFGGVLTIVFIILKLVGTIHWSWWWVLSPLWIGFALSLLLMLFVFVIAVLVSMYNGKKHR